MRTKRDYRTAARCGSVGASTPELRLGAGVSRQLDTLGAQLPSSGFVRSLHHAERPSPRDTPSQADKFPRRCRVAPSGPSNRPLPLRPQERRGPSSRPPDSAHCHSGTFTRQDYLCVLKHAVVQWNDVGAWIVSMIRTSLPVGPKASGFPIPAVRAVAGSGCRLCAVPGPGGPGFHRPPSA